VDMDFMVPVALGVVVVYRVLAVALVLLVSYFVILVVVPMVLIILVMVMVILVMVMVMMVPITRVVVIVVMVIIVSENILFLNFSNLLDCFEENVVLSKEVVVLNLLGKRNVTVLIPTKANVVVPSLNLPNAVVLDLKVALVPNLPSAAVVPKVVLFPNAIDEDTVNKNLSKKPLQRPKNARKPRRKLLPLLNLLIPRKSFKELSQFFLCLRLLFFLFPNHLRHRNMLPLSASWKRWDLPMSQ